MVKVALIGMPIVMMRGSDPFIATGTTDKPRKDLEMLLKQANPELAFVDLGELKPAKTVFDLDYAKMGLDAKNAINSSGANVVVVIGGSHMAALPLYHLPGHVVRADAHGDAYVPNPPPLTYSLNGGTYMFRVGEQGLKKPEEVWNVGVKYFNTQSRKDGVFGKRVTAAEILGSKLLPDCCLFDIDLDVLSARYKLPHGHATSDMSVGKLARLVTKLQPAVVGLFECGDSSGMIRPDIVSMYTEVFKPICKAVTQTSADRSAAGSAARHINPQTRPVSSATYR